MKKIITYSLTLLLLITISGCGDEKDKEEVMITTDSISEDGYRVAIPNKRFSASDARETRVAMSLGAYDINAAGEGLQRYSKDYFNTDSYYLQDGRVLTRDRLQVGIVEGDTEGILGRKSDVNEYGLNPTVGSKLPVDTSKDVKVGSQTVTVVDVFEYDFIQDLKEDAEIKGISLAIILNSSIIDDAGKKHELSEKALQMIAEEAGRQLITYVKTLPEIGANTPVMIGLYKVNDQDDSLGGTYFATGYGKEGIDEFKRVEEAWAVIPSATAEKLDPQVVSQFNVLKSALHSFLPNDIGLVGKGFYIDNQLHKLQIVVTTQAKTYIENEVVVQYVIEQLKNFKDRYSVVVKLNSNMETFAMLKKNKGSNDIVNIME